MGEKLIDEKALVAMGFPEDKYPEDTALEFIRNYDVLNLPVKPLIDCIRSNWWCPEFGFRLTTRKDKYRTYWSTMLKRDEVGRYATYKMLKLSTGGWSGNEDIIAALEKNKMFYACFWVQSRRGGHYIFEINLDVWAKKEAKL